MFLASRNLFYLHAVDIHEHLRPVTSVARLRFPILDVARVRFRPNLFSTHAVACVLKSIRCLLFQCMFDDHVEDR